jgi:hypothetical protein
MRLRPVRRWVIRRGRIVAATEPAVARVFRPDGREEVVTFTPAGGSSEARAQGE